MLTNELPPKHLPSSRDISSVSTNVKRYYGFYVEKRIYIPKMVRYTTSRPCNNGGDRSFQLRVGAHRCHEPVNKTCGCGTEVNQHG